MTSSSEESELESALTTTPPEVLNAAQILNNDLLPAKSKEKYMTAYENFLKWKSEKNATSFSENVLLAYFGELALKYKSGSLWAIYSMLKSTLKVKNCVSIEKYLRLRAFLKRKSEGYIPKKSKILTGENIETFINEAPDNIYLATKDEPASSGDSGDESGSDPESPSDKLNQAAYKQEWACNSSADREGGSREPQASTSSTTQEADSSKTCQPSMPKIMPKIDLPGGAMLYPGVLAGVGLDGLGSNLGLGNLAMGYPHSFILGLANQGQEGASSSNQPQFITIPLSMAMGNPQAPNGCPSASSDDSSELQDLSTGGRK